MFGGSGNVAVVRDRSAGRAAAGRVDTRPLRQVKTDRVVDTRMSVEHASLEELGHELGEQIARTPEYERFEEAREAVQRDEEVQERIGEFERIREEFMQARQTGDATQADLHRVQNAQEELHSMPVMREFLDAQEALTDTLESVNQAISEPLAVDFGGEAGGCCQD